MLPVPMRFPSGKYFGWVGVMRGVRWGCFVCGRVNGSDLGRREVRVVSWLHWRYFGLGGGAMFFECIGGAEEFYQCLYAFCGADDV